ncbi:MAG: carbamoyltransferase HypF [Chthonomonadetes bacterium]|nr:carbamoyltransferase HypF [Chthonomonadetes bacterium]
MSHSVQRVRLVIRGAVQGVGFRPFVYRLATELDLRGWVLNSAQGVFIEVEGEPTLLQQFVKRLYHELPPRAFIQSMEQSVLDPVGYTTFEIRHSEETGEKSAFILPDIATCADCLREIFDPANRRYRYPFTNCTNCGPRYSIIESLPYDRPNTTMKAFTMCAKCREEYENPLDRRFHAQPNACPECGPRLDLWDERGSVLAQHDEALRRAADAIREGRIVAVKGLGGFHLIVDARNEQAVRRLRERKRREEKPFALMYPSLQVVQAHCRVDETEERVLTSPESPIVLLHRKVDADIAPSVAPGNPYLGVMLPYTPLHHLLLAELGFPVVATSGNLSDEPICTDEHEALQRLAGIADLFLVHNRPIARHVDDSVVRVLMGREMVLRRARGYAPLPVLVKEPLPPLLAVGAHLKNTVALSVGRQVFISQHIGDLETPQALEAFRRVTADVQALWEHQPQAVACDLHPDYLSTQSAHRMGLPVVSVQHHYAHVLACMAENEVAPPVLGISWDGTGYGVDGTVWGGEFLLVTETDFERVAHLRPFHLPGGDRAVKEPRRSALGVLYEMLGEQAFELLGERFTAYERHLLAQMLRQGVNAPVTTSAGRLFDAVASLVTGRQVANFEGQAAMELEFLVHSAPGGDSYPFTLSQGTPRVLDWSPMVAAILQDVQQGVEPPMIALRFHNTLVEMMVAVAKAVGVERIAFSGGCFQNAYLTERAVHRLTEEGFRVHWHQRVPPNDGGIALGQVVAAGIIRSSPSPGGL